MNKLSMVRVGDLELLLKEKTQSMVFNISKFSNELLENLNDLKEWLTKLK